MIAAQLLYNIAVALLFGLAAVAGECLLRLVRRPARFLWIAAILGAVAFLFDGFARRPDAALPALTTGVAAIDRPDAPDAYAAVRTSPAAQRPHAAPPIVRMARATLARFDAVRIVVTPGSGLARLDRPIVAVWITCSALGLLVIGLSAMRLARPRWSEVTVDGVPVLVSHDVGPAVIGILRYRIVLPSWALELTSFERALVLTHEREHASAGDPSLLFLATVVAALCPWNVALWWLARRLRFAIELDCDARVLRRRADPAAYGALLLAVSERSYGGAMPIVALAEPVSLVERRIAAITRGAPRFASMRAVAAGVFTAAVIAIACATPRPAIRPALAIPTSMAQSLGASAPMKLSSIVVRESSDSPRNATPMRTPRAPIDTPRLSDTVPFNHLPPSPASTDSPFEVLFSGIALTQEQAAHAHALLDSLQAAQLAQTMNTMKRLQESLPQRRVLFGQFDSTLLTLPANAADVATLRSRLPQPVGPEGRIGELGAGYARLFDGIALPPDQEAAARAAILAFQQAIRALNPRPEPPILGIRRNPRRVMLWPASDSAFLALVSSDADRATLQSRINVVTPPSRPPH